MKKNNISLWKLLGTVDNNTSSTYDQKIKTLCPAHEDSEASFAIDYTQDGESTTTDTHGVGRCWTCQDTLGNLTPERLWIKEFANGNFENNETWSKCMSFFKRLSQFYNPEKTWGTARIESKNIEDVKEAVLAIFNEDTLETLSPSWEEYLQLLVDSGDVYVTKPSEFVNKWDLTFAVGFGADYNIGEVKYHPDRDVKISTSTGTKNGIFMPWNMGESTTFNSNPEKEFTPNLLANYKDRILIVEGQKDMLALRLLGIPAITITGGCKATSLFPEMFTNKEVIIIYDNDIPGYEGARNLALQLTDYASSVKVSTRVYADLQEKEDAFDFFFKYGKTQADFLTRVVNDELFEVFNAEKTAALKREKAREEYEKKIQLKSKQVSTFYEIYDLPMHRLFSVNARLNSFEVQAAHNIYRKVGYKINNFGDMKSTENQSAWARIKSVISKIEDSPSHSSNFDVEFDLKNDRYIRVEAELTEDNMDIYEEIILETNKKSEDAYRKLFKIFDRTVINITKSIDKEIRNDFHISLDFVKESAQDFTEMFIAQDRDWEELSRSGSDAPQTYSVFMPSELIKPNSKAGDKLSLIVGKLKKHKTNQPFLLGFDLKYRNPIEDFKMTDEIKESLKKFRLAPTDHITSDDVFKRMRDMYYGMRLLADQKEVYSELLFTSLELTWSSVRKYSSVNLQNKSEAKPGVLDILMVGDSGTGKSNTVSRFINTYNTGVVQEMSKVTDTALVGGANAGNKNKISLGLFPMNDGGLISLEELSGMKTAEARDAHFKSLLELRSGGTVKITRVADAIDVSATTRLITATNPVNNMDKVVTLDAFRANSYWSAVGLLLSDISSLNRFSFFHFPTKAEQEAAPSTQEILEACNGELMFEEKDWANKNRWIWSRLEEDVQLTHEMSAYVSEQFKKHVVPLLWTEEDLGILSEGRSESHLIRIAFAFAASTVSTNDFKTIILREAHVDAAIEWIKRIYHEDTGIPQMIKRKNSEAIASDQDINVVLGRTSLGDSHNVFYTGATFLSPLAKSTLIPEILFDLYEEINNQMSDAFSGNHISWKLVEPYLLKISQQNDVHSINSGLLDQYGKNMIAAWKLAMKKLKIIKDHPTKDGIFIVQNKFFGIYKQIKELQENRGGD